MKLPGQPLPRNQARRRTDSTDGGREMNALHSTNSSAVVTRLHDVVRSEKSGATSVRGCARGTGRQPLSFMTVIDAPSVPAAGAGNGGNSGEAAYREVTGE